MRGASSAATAIPTTVSASIPPGARSSTGASMAYPETFIVGRDGTILFKHVGPITQAVLANVIRPAIEKALTR
jgi:cytochrome c biogenesis protein CcmG/thiol:disulfide interchange protein DsbE